MNDFTASVVRTATPVVVGILSSSALAPWLDPAVLPQVVAGFISLVWYAAVRVLEAAGVAHIGWLLGFPKQPVYNLDTDLVAHGSQAAKN